MKKFSLVVFFLIFSAPVIFGQTGNHEEIDYLLFLPNSGDAFANEIQAGIQLDNIASHIKKLNLAPGQIIVYGYTAFSMIDIDALDLSRQRADFIINELQKRGISRNLFANPVGHGSVDLWGNNIAEEDKIPNRRARILVDGKIIMPAIIVEPEIVIEPEPEPAPAPKVIIIEEPEPAAFKERIKFPWIILLPFLLIPLFLIMAKMKKEKPEEKPVVKPAPAETTEEIINLEEEIRRRAYFRSQDHDYSDVDQDWFVELPNVRREYEEKGYITYIENGTWWAKKTVVKK